MATLANGSSTCSGGGTIRVYRPQTATPMPRAHRTPTAGAGAGAGACASITATAARPQKRARTSSNSTPASRVATGVAATASVTTARHDTAEEVAGQLLIDKTAAEALAATGFTPRDAEPSHVYEAGHAAFLAVQEAVEAVHARESLPASVEGWCLACFCSRPAPCARAPTDGHTHACTSVAAMMWTPRRAKCGWCMMPFHQYHLQGLPA